MCIWDLEFRFHQRDWKDSVPGLPVKPKQYGHTVFCDIWAGFLQRAVHCAQYYQEGRLEHIFLGPPHTASGEAKLHLCSGTRISHKFPGNLDAVSHEGVVCAPSPHQGCQVWTQCLSHAKQVQYFWAHPSHEDHCLRNSTCVEYYLVAFPDSSRKVIIYCQSPRVSRGIILQKPYWNSNLFWIYCFFCVSMHNCIFLKMSS